MRNPFFYILLLVLVVLDAWLLAHPNLIGQLQDFYLDRTYLETFPKALGTVSAVVGAVLLVAWVAGRLGRPLAFIALGVLLAASAYWLLTSFTQYNSGVDQFTGEGFRAGAILLPGLVALVFASALWETATRRTARRKS